MTQTDASFFGIDWLRCPDTLIVAAAMLDASQHRIDERLRILAN